MCASAFSVQRVALATCEASVKKSRGGNEAREVLEPVVDQDDLRIYDDRKGHGCSTT